MQNPPDAAGVLQRAAAANAVAACIVDARDPCDVLILLRKSLPILEVKSAVFISFVYGDAQSASTRFLLACDPRWCREYLDIGGLLHDPWIAYAKHQCVPIVGSRLVPADSAQQAVAELAWRYGFKSVLLVPTHSGPGRSRLGLLALGSDIPGHFESQDMVPVRIAARSIAVEVQDWWLARFQRELQLTISLTPREVELLVNQACSLCTKRIAAALNVSEGSINSRFQRLCAKLGVANRRAAAKLAVESGLIEASDAAHVGSKLSHCATASRMDNGVRS
jgi:DNA-binding CsgD family transcriptional regulator